jgi:hypothetical protein
MTTKLTAESANQALKPFGLRVTSFSSTKFLVWKGDQSQIMHRARVADLIEAHKTCSTAS